MDYTVVLFQWFLFKISHAVYTYMVMMDDAFINQQRLFKKSMWKRQWLVDRMIVKPPWLI